MQQWNPPTRTREDDYEPLNATVLTLIPIFSGQGHPLSGLKVRGIVGALVQSQSEAQRRLQPRVEGLSQSLWSEFGRGQGRPEACDSVTESHHKR